MSFAIDSQMLDRIGVATPCRADWNAMTGDDKARFCRTCQKNVYNVALMSRDEAVALISEKEGNLCVRLSRRADGTLITNDCPVGQGKVRKRRFAAVMALLAVLIPSPVARFMRHASAATLRAVPALAALGETPTGQKVFAFLDPPVAPPINVMAGAMRIAPPTPPVPVQTPPPGARGS